ncbi:MAG: hypothetical protein EPO21_07935 [Chloroflexota bacterium]|nr:MAG: hypothetical protein EPO21_07935 [Chloroflexota bacterium]
MRRFLMTVLILGSYAVLTFVVFFTSPEQSSARLVFFVGLFLASTLTALVIAHRLSFRFYRYRRFQGSLGRSVLLALPVGMGTAVAAWLQSMRALSLLSALVLLVFVTAAEYVSVPRR